MPKAQQVTALNVAKRNSGLGKPNEFAKSAKGTIGKSWGTPRGGDSYSSGKNYVGLVAMESNTS
ncbi:hypothetical protein LZF95_02640 [Algoriphagus sp. AGSA1]|uniref:hypothetical protein n=1 Tax=Algoriphagus sp. AGSA1 TaxID=2907213 RepID=UPI001F1B7CE6|nr:hypothetical protein [Algoriphagus sp. AGSA1]MCE7053560.1 hypothetical protein [Algoriphagus sp. AGSA1]